MKTTEEIHEMIQSGDDARIFVILEHINNRVSLIEEKLNNLTEAKVSLTEAIRQLEHVRRKIEQTPQPVVTRMWGSKGKNNQTLPG